MSTTTEAPLQRRNTQQLSGGRVVSTVDIDGHTMKLVTSSRRKKTVSLGMSEGMMQLSIPTTIDDSDIIAMARQLIPKMEQRQQQRNTVPSDEELLKRARYLAKQWLNDEVQPASVVWSDRQEKRWGSCTTATRAIRISSMLKTMPQWVIDGVLVHELAHLKYSGHGPEFHAYANQYPKMELADAFLDGVSFAQFNLSKQNNTAA